MPSLAYSHLGARSALDDVGILTRQGSIYLQYLDDMITDIRDPEVGNGLESRGFANVTLNEPGHSVDGGGKGSVRNVLEAFGQVVVVEGQRSPWLLRLFSGASIDDCWL